MIYINHQKKILFVHIPKTGGTFVSYILCTFYGFTSYLPIIKKQRPDHAQICKNIVNPKCKCYKNYMFNKTMGILEYCKTSVQLSAELNMTPNAWEEYYKFAVIREPVDRFISGYRNAVSTKSTTLSLSDYIENIHNVSDIEFGHVFMTQTQQLLCNGSIDFHLIKYENLHTELEQLIQSWGFKVRHPNLPINKTSLRNNYRDEITPKIENFINTHFHEDIKLHSELPNILAG